MKRDELVRIAGEQALLRKEQEELQDRVDEDIQTLLKLAQELDNDGRKIDWFNETSRLIQRLHKGQLRIKEIDAKDDEYSKVTGL